MGRRCEYMVCWAANSNSWNVVDVYYYCLFNIPPLYFGDITWPFLWVTTFLPSHAICCRSWSRCPAVHPHQGRGKSTSFLGLEQWAAEWSWEGKRLEEDHLDGGILNTLTGPATVVPRAPLIPLFPEAGQSAFRLIGWISPIPFSGGLNGGPKDMSTP